MPPADNPREHENCIKYNSPLALTRARTEAIIEFLSLPEAFVISLNCVTQFARKPTVSITGTV